MVSEFQALSGTRAMLLVQQQLAQAGIAEDEISFEAYQLVKMALEGQDPRLSEQLSQQQAEKLQDLCTKRCKRFPLQYLAGSWSFLDFELKVGEGVLIPREDTELLCLAAADCARRMGAQADDAFAAMLGGWPDAEAEISDSVQQPNILDLCAGSGCVGRGILRMVPSASITAVEKSEDALRYLIQNVENTNVIPVKADVLGFEQTILPESVDVIASNPPYITDEEMKQLAPELAYEPEMALYAPDEGLVFYRYFAQNYKAALRKGGWMAFEIGAAQGQAVKQMLQQAGAGFVQILQDGAGRDRVVRARFD